MHIEASLDLERCSHKANEKAMHNWIIAHLRQIDHYEDVNIPYSSPPRDEAMEEDTSGTKQQHQYSKLPHKDSGLKFQAWGQKSDPAIETHTATRTGIPT
jgi:hypothetical protein